MQTFDCYLLYLTIRLVFTVKLHYKCTNVKEHTSPPPRHSANGRVSSHEPSLSPLLSLAPLTRTTATTTKENNYLVTLSLLSSTVAPARVAGGGTNKQADRQAVVVGRT
ncbi:hypothetical protein TcWFU_002960 [Taenia crassiceps]|uniref:Secreted protein n=1 Tax=Taenia crassiceps TaxID=6207 RepID=A0ABR4QCR9_9CEST